MKTVICDECMKLPVEQMVKCLHLETVIANSCKSIDFSKIDRKRIKLFI